MRNAVSILPLRLRSKGESRGEVFLHINMD